MKWGRNFFLAGAACLSAAAWAFPLWLDSPTRSNPFDPRSPLYQPLPTPAPPPSSTLTSTPTPSSTPSATPSFSPTQTPVGFIFDDFEDTLVGTWTGGPTFINVSRDALAPYAGIFCLKATVGAG